jgi:type VI secretion system protein ImpK
MQVDDPFKPSDATVIRPRPGGGGRRADGPSSTKVARPPAPQPSSGPSLPPLPSVARDVSGPGLNPLVQAGSALLLLAGQMRNTISAPDIGGLRRLVNDELRRFEERARMAGVAQEVITAARYALCAALDEAVLSTPWGSQSEWSQQTLLAALYGEAYGGEKFFDMLDRISGNPPRHIDLMELLYLCIAMGFAGKYQVRDRGQSQLVEVQQELYRKIRTFRGVPQAELSPRWRGVEDRRNPLIRYVPWWVIGAAALAVLTVTFALYYSWLGSAAGPVEAALANMGLEQFNAPAAAPPAAGPTLKQLLAGEESRGELSVDEQGGRTVVTVLGTDLFASGSATVNRSYDATLQRVAAAIDRVPGRVLIVGHTDDQPLQSLRYKDNFDLSRERAVSVSKIVQARLQNPSRVSWTGVGSSQPRFLPASTPENRARNRRVEIVHVRGA